MPNRLAQESSPYLLQHKDNPVDWYPWGLEALEKSRSEDKPILVSIGYSACHWCHVMEHESFEDETTAQLMNELFVCIKVDREERPDLDSIYMTGVQAMTGHGGWPLNAFLTPDGSPFYGGTYWPPEDRSGLPGFSKVLQAVGEAYRNRKTEVLDNAGQIRDYIRRSTMVAPAAGDLSERVLEEAVAGLSRQFDGQNGGFGSAPKFPQPSVLEFLLRRHRATRDDKAARLVRVTLDAMAAGGMYDQVGGGFHRYSVDAVWLVPHFEKMLYDNAQLVRVYLDAYRAFGDPTYRRIVEETLDYVLREMTDPDGGFYATQDADSEGEEGKFYVWTPAEIESVLNAAEAAAVRRYYAVTDEGNFEGSTILSVPSSAESVAAELGIDEATLLSTINESKQKLYAARSKRIAPGRDDKILTSWNGMMLRAFAEASRTLRRADYRAAAERNATFVLAKLRLNGRLQRTYKDGIAKIDGFLEDYANLTDGLVALYEATFTPRWIETAMVLAGEMVGRFGDHDNAGFFDAAESDDLLVARPRDLSDGATPSGNAVAASVLLKLGHMTGNPSFERQATQLLRTMARPMAEQPLGFGRHLSTLESYLATPREIAIAGQRTDSDVDLLAAAVYQRFEPFAVLGLSDVDEPDADKRLPFLADRPMRHGRATAYLCERYACMPPVMEPADLLVQLEQGSGVSWQEF